MSSRPRTKQYHRKSRSPEQALRRKRKTKKRAGKKYRTGFPIAQAKSPIEFRGNYLLDTLNPQRKSGYLPKPLAGDEVDCNNFSFIDNPENTLDKIIQISKMDGRLSSLSIHFNDPLCLDIAPYLLFNTFHQDLDVRMRRGGRIGHVLCQTLEKTGLAEHMKIFGLEGEKQHIWPMVFDESRQAADTTATKGVSSEKAIAFVETMNGWLSEVGLQLSMFGADKIFQCVSEILDNALIHGLKGQETGKAWTAGFMHRPTLRDGTQIYICHFAVLNYGISIGESLTDCCDKEIQAELDELVQGERAKGTFRLLRRRWDPEVMRTLCALQDGVTSFDTDASIGGKGLMDLVEFTTNLGLSTDSIEEGLDDPLMTRLAILSGHAYITVPGLRPQKQENGKRRLALNAQNDLDHPPDSRLVRKLKKPFPGTILTARFILNEDVTVPHART